MPVERWRCPLVPQVKSAVLAAAGMAAAAVFFPLWFAIPVMVVLGAWGLGMCVRRSEVVLDAGNGLLVVRLGPIARRVRVASITAVQVDRAKVSIARSDGGEISFYAWRKSRLDAWLRVPMVADDIGHAISRAAAAAARESEPVARPRSQSRGMAAVPLLACVGLLEVVAALLVRVSWPSPVLTALGVILALALGLSGVFYVTFSLWLLVTGRRSGRSRLVRVPAELSDHAGPDPLVPEMPVFSPEIGRADVSSGRHGPAATVSCHVSCSADVPAAQRAIHPARPPTGWPRRRAETAGRRRRK
jgi:hypothetical protein